MPVARNVWQHVDAGSPAADARRLIDGAKNFGRFEAFFLPAAQWEQVREAFWARTGFPVAPGAAVERLKGRLSDAFDRFLEGVADNRLVAFDDDGWRLKTDPAEQPGCPPAVAADVRARPPRPTSG